MLGWLHRPQNVLLHELTLRMLAPSAERGGVSTAFSYMQWLVSERNVSPATEMLSIRSIIQAAKFLYHPDSTSHPSEGDKACVLLPQTDTLVF